MEIPKDKIKKKGKFMNIAIILAGGSGSRTEQSVPKQFISIYEKPIIIYTLEAFQQHPEVDGIIVSCIDGWHDVLKGYAAAAGITKLRWIVEGEIMVNPLQGMHYLHWKKFVSKTI